MDSISSGSAVAGGADIRERKIRAVLELHGFLREMLNKPDAAILSNDTATAYYNTAKQEIESMGKTSMDEEIVSLIRYQASYAAAAKATAAINQMTVSLLGGKRG